MIRVQSLTFSSKYLSVTRFFICSQLREAYENLWGGFTSTKTFFDFCFIRGTRPVVFFNKIWNIHWNIFFKIDVLNIVDKFLEKHLWQSSYSAWLWFFTMHSAVNDFPKNFQYSFFKEQSWQDASYFVQLFLKNFQSTF